MYNGDMNKVLHGHTNIEKRIEGNEFVVVKSKNGFNHNIDYKLTNEFDFTPKVLRDTDTEVAFELLDTTEPLEGYTSDDLATIAKQLREVHLSDVKFPKNNFRKRVKSYIDVIHQEKGLKIPAIENNYKEMMKLIKRMGDKNPCHNDIWWQNIVKDSKGKIWFVDWEYATMGDKHLDLAYFIRSNRLNDEKRKVFLDAYNSISDYQSWIPEWLPRYEMFALWISILWAYAQPSMPFDTKWLEDDLEELRIQEFGEK